MTNNVEGDEADRQTRRVRSVDHAVDLLEALAAGPADGLGVSELARKTGLSKATAHHLMTTLEARRLVRRETLGTTYRLGWALHDFGAVVARSADVGRAARPYLDELALETGESILLGTVVERSVHYLDRGDPRAGFTMTATTGTRSPLHTNASGKLLLAYAKQQFIDDYLSEPLEACTPDTITDPPALRAALQQIRSDGFATCWQERELGLCSVAVAIRGHSGNPVAALTVAGPAGRVTPERVDRYVKALRAVADEIEVQLGAPVDSNTHLTAREGIT